MNFSFVANAIPLEKITSEFTLSEIKKALGDRHIVLYRKYTDSCDKAKVDKLSNLMLKDHTLIIQLMAYMKNQKSTAPQNILEVGTHVPSAATSYTLGPEKVTFEVLNEAGQKEQGEVLCCNGVVTRKANNWDPVSVFAKITVACTNTAGEVVKAKGAAKPDDYSIPPEWAVSAAGLILEKGKSTDVAMKIFFSLRRDASPIERAKVLNLFNMTVPYTKKGGSERLVDLVKGSRRKPIPDYISNSFSFFGIRSHLEQFRNCLSAKGQGKFARDAYLGVPLGDIGKVVQHKITLDDAGVKVGHSILVMSSDVMLVNFLRCNYGNKVVGRGTAYPMLSDWDLNSTKFDCIYVPKPINATYGGKDAEVGKMFVALRKKIQEELNIVVEGKLVCYFTPAVFFDLTYHEVFYKASHVQCASKVEESNVRGERKRVDLYPGLKPTLEIVNGVAQEWTPESIMDRGAIIVDIVRSHKIPISDPTIFSILARNDEKTHFDAQQLHIIASDISRHPAAYKELIKASRFSSKAAEGTVSEKVLFVPNYHTGSSPYILSKSSFETVIAPVRVSIESWKGVLLYSELLPSVEVSDQMTQMMVYMRHCIRSNFNCVNFVETNYKINKIFTYLGRDYFGFDDTYGDMLCNNVGEMLEQDSINTQMGDTMIEKLEKMVEPRDDNTQEENVEPYAEDPDQFTIRL